MTPYITSVLKTVFDYKGFLNSFLKSVLWDKELHNLSIINVYSNLNCREALAQETNTKLWNQITNMSFHFLPVPSQAPPGLYSLCLVLGIWKNAADQGWFWHYQDLSDTLSKNPPWMPCCHIARCFFSLLLLSQINSESSTVHMRGEGSDVHFLFCFCLLF